ncbi:dynamin family protein [Corynebacterium glaucum]|uniref:dynamin family protein n=1 Tax=Corynebacterium glaucum TaxID=187491 RepID=UPI00265A652B|nr:dynamin family protein [Corynebacterium glaucum]
MESQTQQPVRGPRESFDRAAAIARRYGHTDAADVAEALLNAKFRAGTVVVVGEIKRGKSSLVNALVGQRDLLPVDVMTSTSAPIRVTVNPVEEGPAEPEVAVLRGSSRQAIEASDLDKHVTIDGIAGARAGSDDDELATAAAIELSHPELAGTLVVDTPGVGGLDEHAVHAAFNEAHHAGVLLMVCDASTPITKPEMDILAEARKEVGAAIVAVTKTDKNIRRWQSIVEDNERLLRQHLGAEIPVIGVSSLRAMDAQEMERVNPEKAAEIASRSGIVALRQHLRSLLSDPATLGLRGGIESITHTLKGIHTQIGRDIEIHTSPADGVGKLEEEREELERLKEHASEWEQLLGRDIQFMRNRIMDDLDTEIEQVRNSWIQRINSDGVRVLRSKPQVFTSQIEAELTELINTTLNTQLEELRKLATPLFPDQPDIINTVIGAAVDSITPEEVKGREVDKKTKDLLDPSLATMGMLGAGVLSFMIPLAPLAGAVWIGVNVGFKALRNGKQHLISWLREITQTTRVTINRMLDTMLAAARTEMVLRYRAYLRQRQKEVQEHIKEAHEAARASEAERKETITRLTKNAKIVEATIEELNHHLATMHAPQRELS